MREQELMEVLYDISTADQSQRSSEVVFNMEIDCGRSSRDAVNTASCPGQANDSKPAMRSLVKAYLPNKMKTSVNCSIVIISLVLSHISLGER